MNNIQKLLKEIKELPNVSDSDNKKIRQQINKTNFNIPNINANYVNKNSNEEKNENSKATKIANSIVTATEVKPNPLVEEILKNRKAKNEQLKNKKNLMQTNLELSEDEDDFINDKKIKNQNNLFDYESEKGKEKDNYLNYDLPRSVKNKDTGPNYLSKNNNLNVPNQSENNINSYLNSNKKEFSTIDQIENNKTKQIYNQALNDNEDIEHFNNLNVEDFPEMKEPENEYEDYQCDKVNNNKAIDNLINDSDNDEDDDDDKREILGVYNEKLKQQEKNIYSETIANKNSAEYNNNYIKDDNNTADEFISDSYINNYENQNTSAANNNHNNNISNKGSIGQSKIINKYFKPFIKENETAQNNSNLNKDNLPNLKKFQNATINNANQDSFNNNNNNNNNNSKINEILNEKIAELNKEIEKLKKENEKVAKLKSEYDRLNKKITREMEEFQIKKDKEQEEFKIWKEEEIKKIEKDRKVYLRNTKLLQNMPNKKEREEMENLKEQNLKLQEEMKAKDQRNKLAMERLKKQLEEANKKNDDLNKEIKFMEEMRLKSLNSQKEKKEVANKNTPINNGNNSNYNSPGNFNNTHQQLARNNSKSNIGNANANKNNGSNYSDDKDLHRPIEGKAINNKKIPNSKISNKNQKTKYNHDNYENNEFEEKLNYNYGNNLAAEDQENEEQEEEEESNNYNSNNANENALNMKNNVRNNTGSKSLYNYNTNEHEVIQENVTEENDEIDDNGNYYNNSPLQINAKQGYNQNDRLETKKAIQGKAFINEEFDNQGNLRIDNKAINVQANSTKVLNQNNYGNNNVMNKGKENCLSIKNFFLLFK